MELKLFNKIIEELKKEYEDLDYYIQNPTEDFKYFIKNDKYFKDYDFYKLEKILGIEKLRYYQKLAIYFSNYYLKNMGKLKTINKSENQLAYWMATGSGKTLIMKADIYNYLNYLKNENKLNINSEIEIIIMSSLSELVKQLQKEFENFINKIETEFRNIKIKFVIDTIQSLMNKKEYKQTLEINKYRLVLVDEAHIGLSGNENNRFKNFREDLSKDKKNSFLFEYSATFYNVADEKEYGEKIIFEYNYGKFYNDFYGKDFKFGIIKADVIDNENEIKENIKQNLDDFAKKLKAFEEFKKFPDRPLLVVVGNKVNPKSNSKEEKKNINEELSDVMKFIDYLIKLKDIKNYEKIFNTDTKSKTYVIYNKNDEEVLLAFDEEKPFGIINVGDMNGLIEKLKENEQVVYKEVNFVNDNWKFENIDFKDSPINILLGSRKFSQGWNSFRVSQICLINFGMSKGNTIIQIFGRGVRLKGLKNDGKRVMNYVDEESFKTRFKKKDSIDFGIAKNFGIAKKDLDKLKYLETLFIYSLKSTYLKNFIENSTDIFKQKIIETKKIHKEIKKDKYKFIKTRGENFNFLKRNNVEFQTISSISIEDNFNFDDVNEIKFEKDKISYVYKGRKKEFLVNLDLNYFVNEKKLLNLKDINYLCKYINISEINKFLLTKRFIFDLNIIKQYIGYKKIKIYYDGKLTVKKFENLIYKVINDFEKYIEKNIHKQQKKYKLKNFLYAYDEYKVEITLTRIKKNIDLYKRIAYEIIENIKKNLEKCNLPEECSLPEVNTLEILEKITDEDTKRKLDIDLLFKKIDITIHNPIPLDPNKNNYNNKMLIFEYLKRQEDIDSIRISPDKLDKYEYKFLKDLEKYVKKKKLNDEIKVLRNVPKKGSGIIGLDEDFYPDFIIWYKKDNKTHIIFCDPKGIRDAKNYWKVCVVPYLVKKLPKELVENDIEFHSFVITHTPKTNIEWTPIKELEEDKCLEYFNLLFFDYTYQNEKTYIEKLFERIEEDNLKEELENINKIIDDQRLEESLKYYYLLKDKFYSSKNLRIIKNFFNEFDKLKDEKNEVQNLVKKYSLNCYKIIKKEELLKMFFLKYIDEVSKDEYEKICKDFSSIKEILKNKKGLILDIVQDIIPITGSGLIFKIGKAIYEDFNRSKKVT